MFGHRKSPLNKISKQTSVDAGFPNKHSTNPFDNDSELDKQRLKPARASSDPSRLNSDTRANLFDLNGVKGTSTSSYSLYSAKSRYKNDFRDEGGFENQSVQELEDYSVYKAEETSKTVNNCLKIAEDIREDATKTLVTLHQQGDQITRTHATAADIDHDLSRGEKLLGSLGGIFSKTWKPKKNRHIVGPVTFRDDPVLRKGNHLEQREKLGLSSAPKGQSNGRTPPPEPTNAMQKVEVFEIPTEINKLINMQRLIIADNLIERLPMNLGKLQSLKVMTMDGNRLTTLPDELGQLVRLEQLSISGNLLTSMPETLGSLRNLVLLNVSNNKLKSLPESVGSCFSLEELQANENQIEEIPASVCNLIHLKSLCLDSNNVQKIPTNLLKECRSLQNISLHSNPISMEQFQQMEGFQDFEARRKKKFDKQIDSNVMISSKGLDEGVDL